MVYEITHKAMISLTSYSTYLTSTSW